MSIILTIGLISIFIFFISFGIAMLIPKLYDFSMKVVLLSLRIAFGVATLGILYIIGVAIAENFG